MVIGFPDEPTKDRLIHTRPVKSIMLSEPCIISSYHLRFFHYAQFLLYKFTRENFKNGEKYKEKERKGKK